MPERCGARGRIAPLLLARDDEPSAIRRSAAGQDMHQGRLAGAVMADDADAFACTDREIDAVQSADSAEGFLDAVEVDERRAAARHGSLAPGARPTASLFAYFMFALIAAIASA